MRVVYTQGRHHYLGRWLVACYEIGRMSPSDSLWMVPGTEDWDEPSSPAG